MSVSTLKFIMTVSLGVLCWPFMMLVGQFVAHSQLTKSVFSQLSQPLGLLPAVQGCTDQVVLKTVYWLQKDPSSWTNDNYALKSTRATVWIANGDYGLSIKLTREDFSTGQEYNSFSPQCRGLLYQHTQNWLQASLLQQLS